jgi:hypothetical protein
MTQTCLSDHYNQLPKEHREYCVVAPSGFLTNHHHLGPHILGERVTEATATHVIITTTRIEEVNVPNTDDQPLGV